MRWVSVLCVIVAFCAGGAPLQPSVAAPLPTAASTRTAPPDTLSAQSSIALLTIRSGAPLYSAFGHSALRVYDPVRGIDRLYNYGTFSFEDPWFLVKFTYGQLRYFLSTTSFPGALRAYRFMNRPVIAQTLNLTRAQRSALFRFLEHNAQPEHRYYRYDFLYDNCSTRIRDALRYVLGDTLRWGARPDPAATFRDLLARYMQNRPLTWAGMDLGLGQPVDQDVNTFESMFLPRYLMEAADHAVLQTDGTRRPLVARTDTLLWIEGYRPSPHAANWPVWMAWLVFALGVGTTAWQLHKRQPPGWGLDGTLFGSAGVIGLLLTYLWISTHDVTTPNWNLLWAWPWHVLLLSPSLRARLSQTNRTLYWSLTAGACLLVAVAWRLIPQDLPAAFFPIILLMAVRAIWRSAAMHIDMEASA
ncbi:Lnb N-terminal periplasmic domain-containing protein [Salisaeta longa]|uniref:Lnb N-terminal periplasmic domain-containing protein n=1 Tax=Salisaeta longa TaxID=503170 RepID=UPI00041CD637|nr:DUF4105 domain-containing protein [Salisaeta longa]